MLAIEKIGRVPGVKRHGLESVPPAQHAAGPFPYAAHAGLAREAVTPPRDGHGVPVAEADVCAVEVDEGGFSAAVVVVVAVGAGLEGGGAGRGGRGRDLDAVVAEVA